MAKANKVEVQKGPIKAQQPYMQMSRKKIDAEDFANMDLRKSMKHMTLHMPKQ